MRLKFLGFVAAMFAAMIFNGITYAAAPASGVLFERTVDNPGAIGDIDSGVIQMTMASTVALGGAPKPTVAVGTSYANLTGLDLNTGNTGAEGPTDFKLVGSDSVIGTTIAQASMPTTAATHIRI